jgi:hypothetical protein
MRSTVGPTGTTSGLVTQFLRAAVIITRCRRNRMILARRTSFLWQALVSTAADQSAGQRRHSRLFLLRRNGTSSANRLRISGKNSVAFCGAGLQMTRNSWLLLKSAISLGQADMKMTAR